MSRGFGAKLGLSFNRGLHSEPGKRTPAQHSKGTISPTADEKRPLMPDVAIRRLIAEPESADALEAVGDAFANAGRSADAKSVYNAYLERIPSEAVEDKLRRLTTDNPCKPMKRGEPPDGSFVFDPELGVDSSVIAATK